MYNIHLEVVFSYHWYELTTSFNINSTILTGHFLWMQGLGANANSSAAVQTPSFDQTYNCFTFYYHMYGSGVGQLRVSADVNANNQFLWSRTGKHMWIYYSCVSTVNSMCREFGFISWDYWIN